MRLALRFLEVFGSTPGYLPRGFIDRFLDGLNLGFSLAIRGRTFIWATVQALHRRIVRPSDLRFRCRSTKVAHPPLNDIYLRFGGSIEIMWILSHQGP